MIYLNFFFLTKTNFKSFNMLFDFSLAVSRVFPATMKKPCLSAPDFTVPILSPFLINNIKCKMSFLFFILFILKIRLISPGCCRTKKCRIALLFLPMLNLGFLYLTPSAFFIKSSGILTPVIAGIMLSDVITPPPRLAISSRNGTPSLVIMYSA